MIKIKDIITIVIIIILLILIRLYSFLLAHTIVELTSIVVGISIFIISWNSRKLIKNKFFMFIGISYFFVCILDLIHTLSYKGMNIFIGFDANLPTQLWIIARYMESISLLISLNLLDKLNIKFNPEKIFFTYFFITLLFLITVFVVKIFPTCYVEGFGLTNFKKISEYIISIILIISFFVLRSKNKYFSEKVYFWLKLSILITVFQEIFFTLYVDVYGLFNFIGHILKWLSFYFLYKCFLELILNESFEFLFLEIKLRDEQILNDKNLIQKYMDNAPAIFLILNKNKNIELINKKGCNILGYGDCKWIKENFFNIVCEKEKFDNIINKLISEEIEEFNQLECELKKENEPIFILWNFTTLKYNNIVEKIILIGEDITKLKKAELEKEKTLNELKVALDKINTLKGLIPICSYCKKIRTDQGYWTQLEAYIRNHSSIEFSHGICPECFEKYFKDIEKE